VIGQVQDLACRYALVADDTEDCYTMNLLLQSFVSDATRPQFSLNKPFDKYDSYLLLTYFFREVLPDSAGRGPKMELRFLPPFVELVSASIIQPTAYMTWVMATSVVKRLWYHVEIQTAKNTLDIIKFTTVAFTFLS
jgi:hypothetical protein